MSEIFKTFKPSDTIISKYVSYYYLDLKYEHKVTEYKCFPHHNNTISFYKNHCIHLPDNNNKNSLYKQHRIPLQGIIMEENSALPLQIFTPVRGTVMSVKQIGNIHRVVIVFNVLGIQHFFKDMNVTQLQTKKDFFLPEELEQLFDTVDSEKLTILLDSFLLKRYNALNLKLLATAVQYVFKNYEDFSVSDLAEELGISRRHLNRQFMLQVGVSLKKFHEIVWFREIVKQKLLSEQQESFTQLAYRFNFYDQSHLNKTFKKFSHNSPTRFFKKGTRLGNEDTFWHLK